MKLSIVIPAYNEQDTIAEIVREILVINDGSTDKTVSNLRILENKKNMGHAKTLVRGLNSAKGEYVFYVDADNQIKFKEIGFDILSGYRIHRKDKIFRKVVSFILRCVIFLRHGFIIRDANCPFKVFKRSSLKFLLGKLPRNSVIPSISIEILARRYKMKVVEMPVEHSEYKNRKGMLQSLNKKSLTLFWNAFWEVIRL